MSPIKSSVFNDPSFRETLITVFQNHINHIPNKILYRFLENGEEESDFRTFHELYDNATIIASHILEYANPGDRVLLLYPSGLDFADAFFGCMLAGVIAVPAFPPQGKRRIGRLEKIVSDCNANLIMTTEDIYIKSNSWFDNEVFEKVQWLITNTLDNYIDKDFPKVNEEDVAFLQYTSGSTGDPKGVMVKHSNIIHNSKLIQNCNHHTPETIGVSWLPIYHDMGLIGNIIQAFYVGFEMIIMPPTAFVQKPVRWLKTISKYKATLSGGPNFAYDLCVNQIKKEDVIGVDLSSWLVAYNGSEPIRTETMGHFADSFEHLGFQKTSLTPCYGMAETTLIVSSCVYKKVPEILKLNKTNLNSGKATLFEEKTKALDRIEFVGNGPVLEDLEVIIVNPDTKQVCDADAVGEIWISGASVAKGYWNKEELSEEIFAAYAHYTEEGIKKEKGPYLRTGDMGFMYNGQLYISGRLKEMMIINGVNYFPQDIEQIVQHAHPDLQANAGAVFSVLVKGQQELVIVQEVKRTSIRNYDFEVIKNKIQEALFVMYDLPLQAIVLISPGRVSKTSSGKIQRLAVKSSYESGSLEKVLEKWTKDLDISIKENQSSDVKQKEILNNENKVSPSVLEWLTLLISKELQLSKDKINKEVLFSSLSLSSLQSISLSGKISDYYKIEVSPTILFEYPTLIDCAAHITSALSLDNSFQRDEMSIKSINKTQLDKIPVSYAQESLWFIDQAYGSVAYHLHRAIKLSSLPNISYIQVALHNLIIRHEVFRTIIKTDDQGVLHQQVLEDYVFKVSHLKLSKDENIKEEIEKLIMSPFDLSSDLKIRVTVLETEEEGCILLFVTHHIAADGLSEPIFFSEFVSYYNAFSEGKQFPLEQPTFQYTDYATWQRTTFQELLLEDMLKYWEQQLKGVVPVSIANDLPLINQNLNKKNRVSIVLDCKIKESLYKFSEDEGVTVYMVTLAIFKVLLYRYSGQGDICVGTPASNRTRKEVFNMVGMFVNTLALRTDLSDNPSFKNLLKKVKQTTLDAYRYQAAPFEKVVERLSPDRELGKNPLFQILFDFQDYFEVNDLQLGDAQFSDYKIDHAPTMFDLTFRFHTTSEGFELSIDYSKELFSEKRMQQMLIHYQTLLQSILKDSDQSINLLSILTSKEEHELLQDFNATDVDYPLDKTLVDLFGQQVIKTPEAVAIVFEAQEMTYSELDTRSNQLAHYLIERGVVSDSLVGICLERSLDMLVGIIGVLKAGGAYVPIDPQYPQERISYIIEDADISLLLSTTASFSVIKEDEALSLILLDRDCTHINKASISHISRISQADNLAYVIYTSGSTGKPKGVMNEHRGVVNRLLWTQSNYQLTTEDAILQKTSFCFDVSVWELFWPIISGCKLVFSKPEGHKDARYLKGLIESHKITTIHFVPSMLRAFLNEISLGDCSCLQRVLCSGEALHVDQVMQFRDKFTGVQLDNLYGPTEAAIDVSWWQVPLTGDLTKVLIGKPVANTSLYVVDGQDQLLPIGVVGELCIGGVQVARGYRNKESLTQEKFIANPFKAGDRIYKTGDLARWLPDGTIEYIGRKDDQVKIRGYRIELGEIENALSVIKGIENCCVLAKEDVQGNKRLVGYVVVEGVLDKQSIQKGLQVTLPEYMIPQLWVVLDTMPLTSNGKLDKKSLPEPDGTQLSTKVYVAPRNTTEEQLVEIWQELLGLDTIGVHDNFFELGGHSLLATRLVSIIRNKLKVELSIRDIFENITISALGSYINTSSNKASLPEIIAEERLDDLPLSFSQERLWFIDQLEGSIAYHMPGGLYIKGDIDVNILERSLQTIVERHEILRTIYHSKDGIGYQVPMEAENWSLSKITVANQEEFEKVFQLYVDIPFDLSKDYMFRACLYKLANDEYMLGIVFHHICSDGWSIPLFVSEFTKFYKGLKEEQPIILPDLKLQYSDYAVWQRKYLNGIFFENQLSYWQEKLKGFSALKLPTDYIRPLIQSHKGDKIDFSLDSQLLEPLKALCNQEGVTIFMLLLSAFKVLLSKYSKQDDICVGTPIANRTQSELEDMLGYFVNTLALRSDLSGNPSFKDILQVVKKTTLEGYEYQSVPFEKIVERVVDTRDMSMSPLFQVFFVLENTPGTREVTLEDANVSLYSHTTNTSQFDLTLGAKETESDILLEMEYCTALFNKSTIERLLGHYQELLRCIIKNPSQRLDALSMLTDKEEDQILNIFNDTKVAYPLDKTVIDLFSDQALKTPNAIAIAFENETLSYKELEERSNQLANYLNKKGVKSDDLIGISIQRSPDMIIGILGILKSGGAYVPIDASYPQDRIHYILEDANINLFISNTSTIAGLIEKLEVSIILLDQEDIYNESIKKMEKVPSLKDLAYIIYTSGSTGNPKGVMIEHRSLLDYIKTFQTYFGLQAKDKVLQQASISFDTSIEEIFPILISGGTLVISNATKDLNQLLLECEQHSISILSTNPYVVEYLNQFYNKYKLRLRALISGGDILKSSFISNIYKDYNIFNTYGPTESTVCSSYYKIKDISSNISIGVPISNRKIYILDRNFALTPIGVLGEMCIAGDGLARGYLNQEALTKEKFIPNPFVEGEIIYRTGDFAKWLPDGSIEFIGRADNQVKIRGYRIELGEIEYVLSEVTTIKNCCVLAKEDSNSIKRLVGYVVVKGDLDKAKLQEALKSKLPDYMIPQLWVALDEIPLTSNGKIDKKSLPDPDNSQLSTQEYVAPRNETEDQMVAIWQELLQVNPIGVYDNFFELGGHSLLVTQLISRLQTKNFQIEVRDVFATPTIAELSLKLSTFSKMYQVPVNGITKACDRITPSMVPLINFNQTDLDKIIDTIPEGIFNIQDIYPLSPLQEGMYFHHLMSDPDSGDPYITTSLLSFKDLEKRSLFIEAFKYVVTRHDVLRSCILSEGLPQAVQVVFRNVEVDVEALSLDASKDILSQLETIMKSGKHWMDLTKASLSKFQTAEDIEKGCYYLLFQQHHTMIDHVGLEKIVEEIMLYLTGDVSNLVPPVLYRDFVAHTLHQQATNDSETYFRSRLGAIEDPTFPFGLANTLGDGSATRESSIVLPVNLSNQLREISGRLKVSPAVLFHAAYGLVIGRCSNKEYAIFGSLFSGRLQGSLGADQSLGLFINTLPVVLHLEGNVTEYVQQVKKELQGLLPYEQTPLSNIQNWSGTANDKPLFSALLNYRHSTPIADDLASSLGIEVIAAKERTNYPLDLCIDDYGTNFGLTAHVDSNIDPVLITSYMETAIEELIEALDNNQEKSIHTCNIISEEEKQQLLYDFNATTFKYSKDKTLVDLFKEQVAKTPEAIALVFENKIMTYKELDDRSNQVSHYLQSEGVVKDSRLGILFDRSLDMIISILGVLKLGSTYVPLDPALPSNRLDYILKDSDVNYIIYREESLISVLPDSNYTFLNVKDSFRCKTSEFLAPRTQDSIAYVMYTSGTTGTPKGILINDKNIITLINDPSSKIAVNNSDRVLQWSNYAFDGSIYEIFGSLLCGASLYLIDSSTASDADTLSQVIAKEQLNVAFITTALFNALADYDLSRLSSLRILLFGGEKVSVSPVRKMLSVLGSGRLLHVYGPTETTVYATCYEINDIQDSVETIPIGAPLTNTSLYVLNTKQELVPIGVEGELCISGRGVSKGYLNQETLTKENFIPNPFVAGEVMYRTGDLVKWLPDGSIEFIGRADNQVKIRGYRIELGEIERILLDLSTVKNCCVLAKEDTTSTKRLVGYVVVEDDLDKEKLQKVLKSKLPDYMIPKLWVALDEIPLTSNGKLDKKSLPDPDSSQVSAQEYVAPRNETEIQMVAIWQALLEVDSVGIYDNFFELGGHSLLVTRLISRLQAKDFQVGVKDIFSSPTIAELSLKLSSLSTMYQVPINGITEGCDRIIPSMVPLIDFDQSKLDKIIDVIQGGASSIQDIYPLSPLQAGMYFHHLMSNPDSGDPYVLLSLLSFKDLEKRSQFIEAFKYVATRHDVLRSCILSEGLPHAVQVVLRNVEVDVEALSLDTSKDILVQLETIMKSGKHWMDLTKTPLVKFQTAEDIEKGEYYLLFQQHHTMIDHVGLEKIVEEIMLYLKGDVSNLAPPVLYRDFVAHTLHQQATNDSETYFRSRLGAIEEPTFPFGLVNTLGDGSTTRESSIVLPVMLSNQLREISGRLKVSPAVLFHAAYGLVIGRCSNKEYAIFGSLFSGRLQGSLGADQSLGLFINTLPVVLHLEGSVIEYVQQVKKELQDLLPYEQTPLSNIQNWSGTANDTPLFSALLNYRHSTPIAEDLASDLGIEVIAAKERTNYPLDLCIDDYGTGFGLTAHVDSSIDPVLITSYMETAIEELIEALDNNEEKSIHTCNIISEEEKQQLLYDFNATTFKYSKDKTLVDLFKEQAIASPVAIALVFENTTMTYKELDDKSNTLANYLLLNYDINLEDFIGIKLERSEWLIISLLAVMKTGAAYVPIDPDYPEERVAHIEKDSDCKIIIDVDLLQAYQNVKTTKELSSLTKVLEAKNLAYVMYTSGSTGAPKGVMITHHNIVALCMSCDYIPLNKETIWLSTGSVSFDATTIEFWGTLLNGGKLILTDKNTLLSTHKLKDKISQYSINTLWMTASWFHQVVEEDLSIFEGVKYLLTGGDRVLFKYTNKLKEKYPDLNIINGYGPTENTTFSTTYTIEEIVGKDIPIGKPIKNSQAYIYDIGLLNIQPIGVVGELCLGGAGLARGYLNQETLTKEKFIPNPFVTGDTMYRTGDLARWLPDGSIEFVGRADSQVKIRGYRIELGEIERVLSEVITVKNCCVLAKEGSNATKRLIGYVVVEGNLDKVKLQEALKSKLPDYMIPKLWIALDEIPLTNNGKIDRELLPDPDSSQLSTKEYVAPRNETETQMVAIWQELLQVERIGIHDNFFELGGHSLLVTQLVSILRDKMEVELEIKSVFEFNTIEELSTYIDYNKLNQDNNKEEYSVTIEL